MMAGARRAPLVLLAVALLGAGATVAASYVGPAGSVAPDAGAARCDAAAPGGEGYTVSAVAGPVVAGLTVRPAAGSAGPRVALQLLGPTGPLAGPPPVLDPGPASAPLAFSSTRTPGCYVARGRLPAGGRVILRGLAAAGPRPLTVRLPTAFRPVGALMRRVRAATEALVAVNERQRIAPSGDARPVTLRLGYDGRVIRERSRDRVTASDAPGWRRYFFWMLPGGVALARQVGSVERDGRRLLVVSGAVTELGGFIRLLVDPRSGRVRAMRFLAAGHVMHSVYSGFRGRPGRHG